MLSTVINYADIVSGIYSLFRKAFDFRNAIEKIYYKGKRDKYYKSLCDKDLIAWQLNVLETIYKPIIDKDNRVDFTELVIGKTKKRYEYHNRHIKNLIDMIVNKNRDKLELVGIVESLGSLG